MEPWIAVKRAFQDVPASLEKREPIKPFADLLHDHA